MYKYSEGILKITEGNPGQTGLLAGVCRIKRETFKGRSSEEDEIILRKLIDVVGKDKFQKMASKRYNMV